ncbi:FtsK/SpoIIIE domain-containing protein [Herpetosiphon llansteffanensis]|uniref:FtsK/SpoIIIE domain-containing protein n=1 Tax=Herpetosiphon llansteffanensis TaxID=2094568 RepID=UPI000D7C35BE|nr:FtsK/SpoIIIE domain-containing protein [Herpetosiphon llansteffanensis]
MDLQALSFLLVVILMGLGTWLYGLPRYRALLADWHDFQSWRSMRAEPITVSPAPSANPDMLTNVEPPIIYDGAILTGAGTALARPPANLRAIHEHIVKNATGKPYSFPVGWRSANGQPILLDAAFVGDVNHIALTGFTDSGKDSWAQQVLLYLALVYSPQQLQLVIVDGKGALSWIDWDKKEHVALLAETDDQIRPAMDWLREERQRRRLILKEARCEKWEEYKGSDLPLLVVFVSELMLLQDATSKSELADWLNSELTSARSMGIRYIVSGQTFTRLDTRWRSQIGLYVAGYQPRGDADEPNTTFTANEIIKFGTIADGTTLAVPPSALPIPPEGAGVFTCVQGRMARTVRASYLSKEYRFALLEQLPNKKKSLQIEQQPVVLKSKHEDVQMLRGLLNVLDTSAIAPSNSDGAYSNLYSSAIAHQSDVKAVFGSHSADEKLSVNSMIIGHIALPVIATEVVPVDEQRRIIDLALKARSRRQVCQELYAQTGGPKFDWVKSVCDAAGLLMPQAKAA